MWKMWSYQGRQVQAEKMPCLRWSRHYAETGWKKGFRLRLRLFIKKIISPQKSPCPIRTAGAFLCDSSSTKFTLQPVIFCAVLPQGSNAILAYQQNRSESFDISWLSLYFSRSVKFCPRHIKHDVDRYCARNILILLSPDANCEIFYDCMNFSWSDMESPEHFHMFRIIFSKYKRKELE